MLFRKNPLNLPDKSITRISSSYLFFGVNTFVPMTCRLGFQGLSLAIDVVPKIRKIPILKFYSGYLNIF